MSVKQKLNLTSPLTDLKGVGEKTAALFRSIGIVTIGDLLDYYPRDYDYFTERVPVDHLLPGQVQAVRLVIIGNASTVHAGGYHITNFRASDETGAVRLTFYNMPYLNRTIRAGSIHIFRGRVRQYQNGNLQIEQPSIYSPAEYERLENTFQPRYHLTKGLTNNQIIKIMQKAMDACGIPDTALPPSQSELNAGSGTNTDLIPHAADESGTHPEAKSANAVSPTGSASDVYDNKCSLPPDYIPPQDLAALGLMEERLTIRKIHFPNSNEEMLQARRRKVFDEFFSFLLGIRQEKAKSDKITNTRPFLPVADTERLIEELPYRLTASQAKAWQEIRDDLCGDTVMNRLLQGDVGSGKTIIAFLSLLLCAANGRQGLLMVPTEVLAEQHMKDLTELVQRYHLPIQPALLTGAVKGKARQEILERFADGTLNVAIGTHALIEENVGFKDVGLVITDEQHRFGVRQREALTWKGNPKTSAQKDPERRSSSQSSADSASAAQQIPVLVMSATPIPRTLSIILYGDLQVSRLTELPADRLPIKNLAAPSTDRGKMYAFILRQIKQGHQAYVICPAVEESEAEGFENLQNVTDYTANLRGSLPASVRIESLNGRMKSAEKNRIMTAFEKGDIDILVSTTVIEVGINVPNATCMLIENAERFGLSQLHQLRGRIGRGSWQSYCMFLYSDALTEKPERLAILEKTNDGFKIAEEDLKLRGPGDLFGTRQSGAMGFRLADIYEDADVLTLASDYVDSMLKQGGPDSSAAAWVRNVNFRSI